MFKQAKEKLERELKAGKFDRYAEIMKKEICEALISFCQQDEEFAQAVALGGSFEDCMKAVAKNCGTGISDLEAHKRAVQFYFPGADIAFQMTINLNASADAVSEAKETGSSKVVISLEEFF